MIVAAILPTLRVGGLITCSHFLFFLEGAVFHKVSAEAPALVNWEIFSVC